MTEKNPHPTARIIKRLRRHAKKLQDLAPHQGNRAVPFKAVVARAIANTCWQAAGRLEDRLEGRTCTWGASDDFEADYWETACGEAFSFIDGGPLENHIKFCPYCGLAVLVAPKAKESDDDV